MIKFYECFTKTSFLRKVPISGIFAIRKKFLYPLFLITSFWISFSTVYAQCTIAPSTTPEHFANVGGVHTNDPNFCFVQFDLPLLNGAPELQCGLEKATYEMPEMTSGVYFQYWAGSVGSGLPDADVDTEASGYASQHFCDVDAFGLPAVPPSSNNPVKGTFGELIVTDIGSGDFGTPFQFMEIINGTNTNGTPTNFGATISDFDNITKAPDIFNLDTNDNIELFQADYWVVLPHNPYNNFEYAFQFDGPVEDAGTLFIGENINSMCNVSYYLDGNFPNEDGEPIGAYNTINQQDTCGGYKILRVRQYITDIDGFFVVEPQVMWESDKGWVNFSDLPTIPATGPDDNDVPDVELIELTGFFDGKGDVYNIHGEYVPACNITISDIFTDLTVVGDANGCVVEFERFSLDNANCYFTDVDTSYVGWTYNVSDPALTIIGDSADVNFAALTSLPYTLDVFANAPDSLGGCSIGFSITIDSTAPDTDGDGIIDICDLDDDNDGILDVDEGENFLTDSDFDGIPDMNDSDSDNDGCLDAIEGDGGFIGADLLNSQLAGGIDADGIPLIANGGQGVGASNVQFVSDACSTFAENDINQTPEDVSVAGNILTNDTDPDNDPQTVQDLAALDASGNAIEITLDGTPSTIYDANGLLAGTISMMMDGSYTFNPSIGYTGTLHLDYEVADVTGITDPAILTITVLPISDLTSNVAPVAINDTNTSEQDTDVSGNVIDSNDLDSNGDLLIVTDALADTDGDGIANDLLPIGTPTPIYATDKLGNTLLAGTMSLNANGDYNFDPEPLFTGIVPIEYAIEDPAGLSDTAILTIRILPEDGNDTYANDDVFTGGQGAVQVGNVIENDNDPEGDTQMITEATTSMGASIVIGMPTSLVSGGVLLINIDGSYNYTPDLNFIGTEVVVYKVCDDQVTPACENATLYLTTLPSNTINAEEDFGNTAMDIPMTGSVATNDIDLEGDNLTFSLQQLNGGMPFSDGLISLNPDGSFSYMPEPGFVGNTQYTYEVCDDGMPALCTTTTFFITVLPETDSENLILVANVDANTVLTGQTGVGNLLTNDLDPDALEPSVTTPLTAATVGGVDLIGNPVANAGTLTINPDGSYEFIPINGFVGIVTQPYTICDAGLPATCDDSELIIDVILGKFNTTFANDDAAITDIEVLVAGDVLANDTDGELDVQTVTEFLVDSDGDGMGDVLAAVGAPTQVGGFNDMGSFIANAGMIILNANGTYEFTPAIDFVGNVNVPYTKCDDAVTQACDNATLLLTVVDVRRDYGDAMAYPVAYHRVLTDADGDYVLDGTTDVWLGMTTSLETETLVDGTDDLNDDAISFGTEPGQFPVIAAPNTSYDIDITLNSASPDLVFYGMWIDWNDDGIYDDFYSGSQVTASPATATQTITTPPDTDPGTDINVRLRADDDPLGPDDFAGGKTNGEVEDYQTFVVLPIELSYFDATEENCDAILSWESESERNFKHFEIQRSDENLTEFETIEIISGRGNTSQSTIYTYKDAIRESHYYRLKMVDLDETFEYSRIEFVEHSCADTELDISVYPNPIVNGQLNLEINNKIPLLGTFFITDQLGKRVRFFDGNLFEDKNSVQIDVSNLAIGIYYVTINTQLETITKQFVVKK